MANESARWKWTTNIGIPAFAIVLSFITSWSTTSYTVESALQDRTEQGKIVLANIGYRFFSTFIGLYDLKDGKFKKGEADIASYVAVLEDIQTDIRWLRTNPVYRDMGRDVVFPIVQNAIAREVAKKARFDPNTEDDLGIDKYLLSNMCDIYVDSYWSNVDSKNVDGAIEKDLIAFIKRLCDWVSTEPIPLM